MDIKVFEKSGQLWTTSQELAEKFGKRHKNVLEAIDRVMGEVSTEFRALNFRPVEIIEENAIGGSVKTRTIYLSRGGFSIVAMGFTGKKALAWKVKFITAFDLMEKRILKMASEKERRGALDWQQHRTISKDQRHEATDAIKVLIANARKQGSTADAVHFYRNYSIMVRDALFALATKTAKNWRDSLNIKQLSVVTVAEFMVADTVMDEVAAGTHYKDIYQNVKRKILSYADTVGRSDVMLIPGPARPMQHQLM